jgi:hypothetical protein
VISTENVSIFLSSNAESKQARKYVWVNVLLMQSSYHWPMMRFWMDTNPNGDHQEESDLVAEQMKKQTFLDLLVFVRHARKSCCGCSMAGGHLLQSTLTSCNQLKYKMFLLTALKNRRP